MQFIIHWLRRFLLWVLTLIDHCPHCQHSWAEHKCPASQPTGLTPSFAPLCALCGAPILEPVSKNHDGCYRHPACKVKHFHG